MQLASKHIRALLALFLALALVQLTAQAKAAQTKQAGEEVWLQVNELTLSANAYRLLYRGLNQALDDTLASEALNKGIIENQLLGEAALQQFSLSELHPQQHIDFPFDVLVEDQLANFYRLVFNEQLEAYLSQTQKAGVKAPALQQFVTAMPDFTRLNLKPYIETNQPLQLMRYRLSLGQVQTLSLKQLSAQLNVQGRNELAKNNIGFLQQQLQNYLIKRVVLDWVENYSGLSTSERKAIRLIMRNKELKKLYLAKQGLVNVLHKDNPILKQQAQLISQAQISAYYQQHKEDYREIQQARIVLFASYDQALLQRWRSSLMATEAQKKLTLDLLKQEHKKFLQQAGSTSAGLQNGYLSLQHQQHEQAFLRTLAFSLPERELSQLLRSPLISAQGEKQTPYWLMLWIDQRQSDYLAADSLAVRYEVGKILAAKKMAADYHSQQLIRQKDANIYINQKAINHFQQQAAKP